MGSMASVANGFNAGARSEPCMGPSGLNAGARWVLKAPVGGTAALYARALLHVYSSLHGIESAHLPVRVVCNYALTW